MTAKPAEINLTLGRRTGQPDGVYFVAAAWSYSARAFIDFSAAPHKSESAARAERDTVMAGMTRTVRYTVHDGYVTTRRQL